MATDNHTRHIGIVTVVYNGSDYLAGFLRSIKSQVDVRISLYVVDSGSTDNSVALIRSRPLATIPVHVIETDENVGVACGNNIGINRALRDNVDWVLLLNNDTEFSAGTIASLVAAAEAADARLIAPVIEGVDPPGSLWYGGGRLVPWQGFSAIHANEGTPAASCVTRLPAERTGYAPTCCLLIHPSVFATVGLMDASYFVYFDDVDFVVRCQRAGYDLYVTSQARLLHKAGSATGGGSTRFSQAWSTRNRILISRRFLPWATRLIVFALMQGVMLTRMIVRRESLRVYLWRQRWFVAGLRADINDHSLPDDRALNYRRREP